MKQYEELKDLVRREWTLQGGIEDAIKEKQSHYASFGKKVDREGALDEIIADSTYEMIQSQDFTDMLCKENRSLAQSILNAIKNVIDKIRTMLKEGSSFTPKQNASLLSELDILKGATKLWTDGLMVAAENRAAVGRAEGESFKKYLIGKDDKGNDIVIINEDVFEGREGEKRKKVVSEYLKEHVGEMFTIIENGKKIYLGKDLPEKYNRSQSNKRLDRERRFAKQKAAVGVGEMIEIASGEHWEKPVNEEKHKKDAKYGFYKYDTRFAVKVYADDHDIYNAELVVRHDADGELYLYDIQGIKKDTAKIGLPLNESQPIHNNSEVIINGSSNNSISENSGSDKKFSLKNKNITPQTRIPYVNHSSYMSVRKNDYKALNTLQDKVRNLKRGTYENKATGYRADINGITIGKIISPKPQFYPWVGNYIENLNAAMYLPELFQNAVYVDTKPPQKKKNKGKQIQGYHHFIAPIRMDGKNYRTRIVAREKKNSDTLYIVETEIMTIKNGAPGASKNLTTLPGQKPRNSVGLPFDISIPELINGVKIYDYDTQKNDVYTQKDIKYSLPDEASVYDYVDEHETEFANMPSVRDYEAKAQRVKNQTYDELAEQVRKLSLDKRLTHGKILDESSVKEELNELVRLLMTYSESYAVDGSPRKVNSALVNMATQNASVIYKAIKEGDFAAASNVAYETAREIVENLEMVNDSAFVQYKELRSFLKTTKIEVSEAVKSDIPDYNAWRKKQFGRLKLVKDGGVPVDAVYEELCEVYPELFDIELTHPTDQLMAIADAREALEPYDIMLSEEQTEQLIKQTAQDILDVAAIGKPWKSWADKKKEVYDEKIKTLKAMHSEAVRDVKIKERLRATRMLNAEKVKAKERADRKKAAEIRRRYMVSIEKSRKWLTDMLVKPADDKHIPEGFRAAVADLMAQVDMQSKKSKKIEQKRGSRAKRWGEMDELRARLSEIAKEDDSGNFEYDGYIFDIMGALAEKMAGKAIDEASTQQLHEFDILLKYIVTNVRNYNKAFSDNLKEGISALGNESINSAKNRQKKLKDGKYRDRSGLLGGVDSILNETMVTPRDFFELLGGGLNKAFLSMRKGFDKHVDNM